MSAPSSGARHSVSHKASSAVTVSSPGPGSGSLALGTEASPTRSASPSAEDLFEQLGAFEACDARFVRFLEGLVSADVIPDEPTQWGTVSIISPRLRAAGAELRETGTDGGYPVFSVVPVGSARNRRPKNLIFATLAKPDIRFRDDGPPLP